MALEILCPEGESQSQKALRRMGAATSSVKYSAPRSVVTPFGKTMRSVI
jgi:hypothetical protein